MKRKITLVNIFSSVLLQLVTIIGGFIIPRIILQSFGSVTNGLVSSLTQYLSYISLAEGGITSVIVTNLYKPLVEGNRERVSEILVTATDFFRKIGWVYVIYSIALGVIYPLVFQTSFSFEYIWGLTMLLSLSLMTHYFFSASMISLLNADKKVYIVSFTQTIIILLNVVLTFYSVSFFPNIHFIKFITGVTCLIQPIVLYKFCKRYNINWKTKRDKELIKDRWNGFAINIAAFVHGCTDVSLLTVFSDLTTVSVYGVYALISNGIKQLISSMTVGINPLLGQAYAKKDFEDLNEKMDVYEYIIFLSVFFIFSVAGLLITPFVLLYTNNISDANYNRPLFGILILLSEAIYLVKFPHLNLAYSANRYKDIKKHAYIETFLNISLSLLLVSKYELLGVTIGTIVAMFYRMVFHVYYTKKIIPGRRQRIFYRKFLIFFIASILGIGCCHLISDFSFDSWGQWIIKATIFSGILLVIYSCVSLVFFKKEINIIKKYIINR